MSPCAACGRVCRGERCIECVRKGHTAPPLFCTCAEPLPRPLYLFGARLQGTDCARCERPIL